MIVWNGIFCLWVVVGFLNCKNERIEDFLWNFLMDFVMLTAKLLGRSIFYKKKSLNGKFRIGNVTLKTYEFIDDKLWLIQNRQFGFRLFAFCFLLLCFCFFSCKNLSLEFIMISKRKFIKFAITFALLIGWLVGVERIQSCIFIQNSRLHFLVLCEHNIEWIRF